MDRLPSENIRPTLRVVPPQRKSMLSREFTNPALRIGYWMAASPTPEWDDGRFEALEQSFMEGREDSVLAEAAFAGTAPTDRAAEVAVILVEYEAWLRAQPAA